MVSRGGERRARKGKVRRGEYFPGGIHMVLPCMTEGGTDMASHESWDCRKNQQVKKTTVFKIAIKEKKEI